MTEENDPIGDIESKVGMTDTGRTSYLMLAGAMDEGATMVEAYLSVAAYYCGMFSAMGLKPEEDDGRESS